jgi:quercetin dioxygenase-like cupin family protein
MGGVTVTFIDLSRQESREVIPGYRATFVHSENMTMAFWEVDPGARMPEHSHPHEQISSVVEGEFEMTVAGEPRRLNPGVAAVIPANVPHGGVAVTRCRLIDAFCPVRQDYRQQPTPYGGEQPMPGPSKS